MARREFAGGASVRPETKTGLGWGALLHLGSNMWDDYDSGPDDWAKSEAEEKVRPNPYGPSGERRSNYRSYLRCHDDMWRMAVDRMAADRMDFLFIDIGEGMEYPSHPELAVQGTWSVEKVRRELARIRALGIEPLPKLNFSTSHDAWLKEYHRMVSTKPYYQVVADVIRDTCEIFGNPRLFHIGYDEEMPIAQANSFLSTCRRGDLWWQDLFYTVGEVERHGARAVMWADAMWTGRDEYLRRMSKRVLQSNWYYRSDFSEKKLKWNYEFEKKGGWGETVNGAAAFKVLEAAGFDQLPCTSNVFDADSADAVVKHCKACVDPSRLKGFCMASWARTVPENPDKKKPNGIGRIVKGLDFMKEVRDRYYPEAREGVSS